MGIQSPSASFTRYYIPEPVTEDFWNYVDEKLRAGSFKDSAPDQERSVGFSSLDDLFDPAFAYGSYHKGEYVGFHFRVDQRKVPAMVLQQFMREAVNKYRAEHEDRWPSRQERQNLREEVHNWLLGRSLPQPSACEAVWNPVRHWLLLGTSSPRMVDHFLEHFEHHLRLYPVPLYHVQWATYLLPLDGRQKDALNALVPVKSANALYEGRFLGYEFLTWLWFFKDCSNGVIPLPEGKQAQLDLGERLSLSRPDDGKERVICTTQEQALHEARTALQQGKLVEQIHLCLQTGDNEYSLTLDTSLAAVKGLKTPKTAPARDEDDPDARFLERMYFIEEVFAILDTLYGKFLSQRLSPGWKSDTMPALRKWLAGEQLDTVPF